MPESRPAPIRHHDLDALRATAMLLGILLHACTRFMPFYDADDAVASSTLGTTIRVVHGFRMPLFFLISGFFTAMLWHKRGVPSLLKHRAKRVLLPFALSVIFIVPFIGWGFSTGERLSGQTPGARPNYFLKILNIFDLNLTHLWFLWMLWVLVCLFAVVVGIGGLIERNKPAVGAWFRRRRGVFIVAMLAVTVAGQYAMTGSSFGAGYTEKILLDPAVLMYYAGFFAVGSALCQPSGALSPGLLRVTKRWVPLTIVAVLLAVAALQFLEPNITVSRALQVPFTWVTILALMGMFHHYFSTSRPWVRWLSDASYWLYLMHLPLVFVFQGLVTNWALPFYVKTLLVFLFTMIPLLLTYQFAVRYTPIGTLLNGKRTRAKKRNARFAAI
ncbi:MAG: acyltransferase family protein [Arachnia sp.]